MASFFLTAGGFKAFLVDGVLKLQDCKTAETAEAVEGGG
jgi:hypothetical protein